MDNVSRLCFDVQKFCPNCDCRAVRVVGGISATLLRAGMLLFTLLCVSCNVLLKDNWPEGETKQELERGYRRLM